MSVNKVLKRPAAPGGEIDTHETWFQLVTLPERPCTASEGQLFVEWFRRTLGTAGLLGDSTNSPSASG